MGDNEQFWRRELAIGAGLLGVGLFVLPPAIYVIGGRIFGDYSPDGGVLSLAESVWLDLVTARPFAWVLVLSPYVLVQVVRGVRQLWRPPAA